MVTRVRNEAISKDDLIAALEKTARQATAPPARSSTASRAFREAQRAASAQPAQARAIVEDAVRARRQSKLRRRQRGDPD